ncbi:unnamed protein product [Paramecium octaurelia]|uniref:Uncharacterized protein n=1 Tax=Paramecium octaurelia TaxID=43137 RepID=A0A8S1YNN4_PAROT|nr:unnamed protein product [Paramecium octaurelia]
MCKRGSLFNDSNIDQKQEKQKKREEKGDNRMTIFFQLKFNINLGRNQLAQMIERFTQVKMQHDKAEKFSHYQNPHKILNLRINRVRNKQEGFSENSWFLVKNLCYWKEYIRRILTSRFMFNLYNQRIRERLKKHIIYMLMIIKLINQRVFYLVGKIKKEDQNGYTNKVICINELKKC